MKGREKREIPEKTCQPTALFGTIPTCESPVTRPGVEPGSPWWKASGLTARLPRPQHNSRLISQSCRQGAGPPICAVLARGCAAASPGSADSRQRSDFTPIDDGRVMSEPLTRLVTSHVTNHPPSPRLPLVIPPLQRPRRWTVYATRRHLEETFV
ncbi:hypothetical protein PR048_020273 [Dryococelus australis]|uniref:Uncharacterized protein n=1 Tax=Dryococelus australis TaxID=614101 RepID=A0ABQ9H5U3_9NEOP|nr:hypothetical protein PR048_020273 [Dryococelus australis]